MTANLTISLIVRNEAESLGRCLDSVQGLGDEIVVVDTGSTDRTREVAARRGARVFDFPWCEVYNDGEGTAGDGRIEGSIGLQEVVVGAEVEVSTLGTDDSLCHRPCQVERSADGQYAVADLQRGAMPWPLERDGGRSKDTGVVGGRRCRFAHGCRQRPPRLA